MTDVFSKLNIPLTNRDQREPTVARVLVSQWFYKFSVPAFCNQTRAATLKTRSFSSSVTCMVLYKRAPHHSIQLGTVYLSNSIALSITCCAHCRCQGSQVPICLSYCTTTTSNTTIHQIFSCAEWRVLFVAPSMSGLGSIRPIYSWRLRVLRSA